MINFFDSAYGESTPVYQKSYILESFCHYGGFSSFNDSESFDAMKKRLNLYLSSQETRSEGLVLLGIVIDRCDIQILQKNILIWMQMLLKSLEHPGESSESRKLSFNLLKKIARYVLNFPHLKREASTTLLPTLLDILLESSMEDEWIEQAADCLSAYIKYFPVPCSLKKDKIEEFLILLLDRWELKEFEPIAECFANLPACSLDRNGKSVSFQKMWATQFKQFINVQNAILNILYDSVENGCGDLKICSAKQLPPIPDEPLSAALKLIHRFKAFGLCLSKMLVSASRKEIVVPTDALLKLISRTLSVTPSHMEHNLLAYSVLPSLYLTALTILESFILSCDKHAMSVCPLVSRLLTQAVKSSSLKNSNSKDCLNLVRCAAYQVFQLYTERFQLFSVPENHREYLVSAMICDTKPFVSERDGVPISSDSSHFVEPPADSKRHRGYCRTSTEALKALNGFVAYGNLDDKSYENIYSSVVGTLLEIQEKAVDLKYPYSDENYRLSLYTLLQTLVTNFSPHNITIWSNTVYVATNGLEDLSAVVRKKCQEILGTADIFLNTDKERIPGQPHVKQKGEAEMTLNGEQDYNQILSTDGNFSVVHPGISNEHSTANEASVEMVNGVLPVPSVSESPPSQPVDSTKSFHSEHSKDRHRTDSEVTAHEEDNGDYYTNSNAYSASEPEVEEEEEMEVEDEEDDYKEAFVNHNGYTSEEECASEEEEEEEEESVHSKRHSSSEVQSNGLSPKKEININIAEDQSDPDASAMLQDFNPASPDTES